MLNGFNQFFIFAERHLMKRSKISITMKNIYPLNKQSRSRFASFLLIVAIGFTALGAKAQNGPAGIGSSTDNVLWLRADQGTSTTTNGNPVSSWDDISGNANHSAQGNGGFQPVYILSGINGLPTIRFDGNDDYLVVPDADNLDNTNGVTVIVVAQPNSIDANPRGIVSKRVTSGNQTAYSLFTYTSTNLYFDSPDRINGTTAVTNNPQILTGVYDGSVANPRARVFQDGVQTGSGNSDPSIGNMASNLHIGILNAGYGQGFRGDISEVIVYRDNLNLAQRLIVETYLDNRYNIGITPTSFSSTTHTQDFTGIGHSGGDKYSDTENLGSGILLSERNGSLDEPNEFVFTGHDGTAHGTNTSDLPTIAGVNLDERWDRIYFIERIQGGTVDAGTTDIRITFDFTEAGLSLSTDRVYYLLYRAGTSGSFSVVPGGTGMASEGKVSINVSSANFASGYYTIVRSDQEVKTWYSYNTGDWDDWETWSDTPFPGGFNNPTNEIPGIMDRAVISNNKTVTVTLDDTQCGILDVIDGTVDFGTTIGHTFSTITGQASGKIRLAADNFPSGDANGFANAASGGTVEYYGTGYELPTSRTYRNMIVNLTNPTDQLTLLSNYTLNGSLTISRGEFHFGDGSSEEDRTLTINENLEVSVDGTIRTGSADARHQLDLYGDFTNFGDIQFTNRVAANYNTQATDGIVDVNFLSATRNQNMILDGPTRFYRIAIEKGISNTYELYMEASDAAYFELFGYANEGHPDNEQLTVNNNSFGLAYGTVRVGDNITIPRLNGGGNYNVSENAILWVDGGTVTKPSGTAVVVYGKVKVSDGTFNADINSGITTRINGTFESTGGTTNLRQFRTSVYGSQHQGGYIQSGGTVNLLAGSLSTDYYRFTLTYPGNVFSMSGGTLHIQRTGGRGGIFINSDEVNQNITGGTVICEISDANDFIITSKAPFWNLELRKSVVNTNSFILDEGVDVGGTNEYLEAQPLKVLRNFYIRGIESGFQGVDFYPVTDATNVNDVYIGGSFYIESGSQYWTAADGNRANNYNNIASLPSIYNTTYFNQTAGTPSIANFFWWNQGNVLNYDGNGTPDADENMAEFGRLVLDRNSGNELRLASSAGRGNSALTLDVNGDLEVLSGTLCQGRFTIRTWASITNNDRMGTYYSTGPYPTASGTPSNAQVRFRESDDSAPSINSTPDAIFGNTRFNVNPNYPFEFQNNMYFERLQYMRGILYLGQYNMKVDDLWDLNNDNNTDTNFFIEGANTSTYLRVVNSGRSTGAGSNQLIMIITDGKASDGGLTLKVYENSQAETGANVRNNRALLTFPVGFSTDEFATELTNTYYRPAQVKVSGYLDDGYLTIRPVSGVLQTTQSTGGEVLQHYWRVTQSDFTDLPTLAYRFYYRNQSIAGVVDLPGGAANEANYVPGKVEDEGTYQRSYESGDPAELDTDGIFSGPIDANTRVIVFNGNNTGVNDDDLFGFSANAPGIAAESARYTTGQYQRFIGAPTIYYTRLGNGADWYNRNWQDGNNWSLVPHDGANNNDARPAAGTWPAAGDIAVIGYGGHGGWVYDKHSIQIPNGNNINVAEIRFDNPRSNSSRLVLYRNATLTFGQMLGTGGTFMERINAGDSPSISGDFGEFYSKNTFTYNYYLNSNGTYNITPPTNTFPNLRVEGGNNSRIAIFQEDIHVNNNFTVDGNTVVRTNNGADGDITVDEQLRVGGYLGGNFQFNNSPARTVEVGGIWFRGTSASSNITVLNSTPSSVTHTLIVNGDIIQDRPGDFDLFSGNNPADNNVVLELGSTGTHSYTQTDGNTPEFYRIVMNKGTSQSNTFTFSDDFTLNGPTSGVGVDKALTMENGRLYLDDAGININLTTGDDSFVIPSSAGLVVSEGEVNVSGANSGILLDGLLRVETGGTIDMDGGPGVNNFIEYSASGKATIEVTGGTLTVGSQIRRGTSSSEGLLRYTQTGGTVTVGKNAAPVGNRGVFEIINNGSRFIQTSGNLTIVRPQTSASEASVLIEPSLFSVGNSTIQIGNDDTPTGSVITLKSSIELGNVTVTGANGPTARLQDRSLSLKRDLTIGVGSTFDGTGVFNLTVKRHIVNSGTANLNVDSLFLLGASNSPSAAMQEITGSVRVNNLIIEPETSVTLQAASGLEVDEDMYINSGQLIDGGNEMLVKGNVTNNASHASSNPATGGFVFGGSALQRIYGTGQFGRIEINNSSGVQLENSITMENDLTITDGILQLQNNKLTLGLTADIVGAPFDENKMIAVQGADYVPGLEKVIPVVPSAVPTDPYDETDPAFSYEFTFPLGVDNGTERKYTPIELYVASNDTQGSIRVASVNSKHITFDATQTDVLQYFWIINSSNLSDFTSLMHTHYADIAPGDDVVGDESTYIGAKLYDNFWAKYIEVEYDPGPPEIQEIEVVYEADDYVAYITDGVDLITGEYTAGIQPHIPDEVPIFYTKQDGDWTDANTWEREDGGMVPAGGPVGQRVHIRTAHTVTVTNNYRRAYRTTINGRLELGSTYNHILGYVSGTGTLSIESSSLPAGDYTDLFACGTGGTMEWAGGTYGLPSSITHYNNLTITGSGTKTMPNSDVTICGDLRIEGSVTLKQSTIGSGYRYTTVNGNVYLLDNATWDMNTRAWISLYGNFQKSIPSELNTFYGGQFFDLRGSGVQVIEGDFTGSNWFNNIYLRNNDRIILNGELEVRSYLQMIEGRVINPSPNITRLTRTIGNGLITYFNGLFEGIISINMKDPGTSNKFLPVGKNGIKKFIYPLDLPASVGYWTGEYFNTSATSAGMSHLSMDDPPLKTISQSEYWRITGPNGVASRIQLTLDGTSDVAAGVLDINDLRIVYWNGSEWQVAGGGANVVGSISAGTISTTGSFTFDGTEQYFTLGAVETVVIPTAQITSANAELCAGDTYQLEISLTGNAPWEIDYNDGTTSYTNVSIAASPHTIVIVGMAEGTYTYTIDDVRDNAATSGFIYGSSPVVNVYANPTQFVVTSGGNICGATTTTIELSDSELGFTYQLYRNGVYFGSTLAGTGDPLSFTGVDQAGTYEVRAFNDLNPSCFDWMSGSPSVELGSAATAEITSLLSAATICEGEGVEIEITFTGTPPFTFTLVDNHGGNWTDVVVDVGDLVGSGPYTYNFIIPDQLPTWTAPSIPNAFNYTLTEITDGAGCGAGTVVGAGVDVDVYKIPETGPQYHIPNTFGE